VDPAYYIAVDDAVVMVIGDIGPDAAAVLADALTMHSRAGTVSIDVDLSAVTRLDATAVDVLADACALAERRRTTCALIAVPGGEAHRVLSHSGLPTTPER
jgi:anti-anti-sigma regulatory factor